MACGKVGWMCPHICFEGLGLGLGKFRFGVGFRVWIRHFTLFQR